MKLNEPPPKLVIASQAAPGQVLVVTVSKSFSALEYNEQEVDEEDSTNVDNTQEINALLNQFLVSNALVTVTFDGRTETLTQVEKGIYASLNINQNPGTEYELRVIDQASGLEVTSRATFLERARFESVEARRKEEVGTELVEVTYAFEDEPGPNWYVLTFYSEDPEEPEFTSLQYQTGRTEVVLIADNGGNEGIISGTEKLYQWEQDSMAVSVSNISQEYYNYLQQWKKRNNSPGDLLSEPVTLPTNIRNGYGFFTTHYPDVRVLSLK
ncbi:MAG: DUF4249 family protein [Salibacteraceae bacterium]